MVDEHTDRRTDICNYRVASLLKIVNHKPLFKIKELSFVINYDVVILFWNLRLHFNKINTRKRITSQ